MILPPPPPQPLGCFPKSGDRDMSDYHNCQSWLGVNATGFQWEKPRNLLNILHYSRQPPQQNATSSQAEKPWYKVRPHLVLYLKILMGDWASFLTFASYLDLLFYRLSSMSFAPFYFGCLSLSSSYRTTPYFIDPLSSSLKILFFKYTYIDLFTISFPQIVRS